MGVSAEGRRPVWSCQDSELRTQEQQRNRNRNREREKGEREGVVCDSVGQSEWALPSNRVDRVVVL